MKKAQEDTPKIEYHTLTRKMQIIPIGEKEDVNEAYEFIRNGMYAFYKASNLLMGQLAASYYKNGCDLSNAKFLEEKKEIFKHGNPILSQIEFPKGMDLISHATRRVDSDFRTSIKNGLARGERSITNYKRDNPIPTLSRNLKFDIDFTTLENGEPDLNSISAKVKWVNKKQFTVVFGNPTRSVELRKTMLQIHYGNYLVGGSKISIEGKKIFLHLTVQIPIQEMTFDENTIVGVDLGIKHPAVCALNNNIYKREYIGAEETLLHIRTRIQNQKRALQKSLTFAKSQHGRTRKLAPLERLKSRERNFAKTFNNKISYRVVQFALKNNAKYIHIENMEGYGDNPNNAILLRNWSYYQLEEMIIQKAKRYGIIVRKVNPYNTSQVCSFCGSQEEGQLLNRERFVCKNPDCVSHKFNSYIESDFNAARNIAKSTQFSIGKKSFSQNKEQHEKEICEKS